jgi:hypothetical protein
VSGKKKLLSGNFLLSRQIPMVANFDRKLEIEMIRNFVGQVAFPPMTLEILMSNEILEQLLKNQIFFKTKLFF